VFAARGAIFQAASAPNPASVPGPGLPHATLQPTQLHTTMRISAIAALLLMLAGPRALAEMPNTVSIAANTSDINPKIADEVQSGLANEILYGLGEVFSNLAKVRVELTQVSAPKIAMRIQECKDAECLEDVAKSAGVDLVVQVRVQTKKALRKGKPEYVISMAVARDVPARDVWREKANCPGCTASEIKHMASLLASTIADQIKIDVPPAAAVLAPRPYVPPRAAPAPAPVSAPVLAPAPPAEKPRWHVPRYLSVAAIVGGAALIATGAYLIHLDGQGTCDLTPPQEHCPERHKTQGLGIGFVAGGGLAALGGLAGLIFFPPQVGGTNVAVGFGASSLSIAGAF